MAWWEIESQLIWSDSSPEPEFVEEESSRRRLEDRQDRRMTSRRRLVCNLIVSGLINGSSYVFELDYFNDNLECTH